MNVKELATSKTVWTALTSIVGVWGGFATGSVDLSAAIQVTVSAALAIFLKDGIVSSGK